MEVVVYGHSYKKMEIKVLTNRKLHIRINRYAFLAYFRRYYCREKKGTNIKTGGEINANI